MHTSQQTGAVEIEVTRAMSESRYEETPVTSVSVGRCRRWPGVPCLLLSFSRVPVPVPDLQPLSLGLNPGDFSLEFHNLIPFSVAPRLLS